MELLLESFCVHPEDKQYLNSLRYDRMARDLFQPFPTRTPPPQDQVRCSTFEEFKEKLWWFNEHDSIHKNFYENLYEDEQVCWLNFTQNVQESLYEAIEVYCFEGESCCKHHLRYIWMYDQQVVNTVSYYFECFCIKFPSLETVLEVHFERKENFALNESIQYTVRVQNRFQSKLKRSLNGLLFVAKTGLSFVLPSGVLQYGGSSASS